MEHSFDQAGVGFDRIAWDEDKALEEKESVFVIYTTHIFHHMFLLCSELCKPQMLFQYLSTML